MAGSISPTRLGEAVRGILDDYRADVVARVDECTDRAADELVRITRETAPRRTGRYRRHIAQKTTSRAVTGKTDTWYVSGPHYRLTHLLEDGHKVRNEKGGPVYGQTRAFGFLSKAVDQVERDYERDVRRAIGGI